jgi:hypothetical protein
MSGDLFEGPSTKEKILALLKSVKRDGMEDLIAYLLSSDFFTAPASTKHHSAFPGGLAEHSYAVVGGFTKKVTEYGMQVPADSIAICGTLHDTCKIGIYRVDEEPITAPQDKYLRDLSKNKYTWYEAQGLTKAWAHNLINWYKTGKEGEEPTKATSYVHKDENPIGHGEKSVIVLQKFIRLTDQEIAIIRYHMGPYSNVQEYNEAVKVWPEIVALFCADMESSHLLEKRSK